MSRARVAAGQAPTTAGAAYCRELRGEVFSVTCMMGDRWQQPRGGHKPRVFLATGRAARWPPRESRTVPSPPEDRSFCRPKAAVGLGLPGGWQVTVQSRS